MLPFFIGLALTIVFLIALTVEKRSGRVRENLHKTGYRVGVTITSLLGPVLMMIGLLIWPIEFWIWIGILVSITFLAFLVAIWFVGSFHRVINGSRIISVVIAIEIFGLFMMAIAAILHFGFSEFYAADTLLALGLLCAIPAAMYLVVYFASKLFEKNEAQDNYHYIRTAHTLPTEFHAEDEELSPAPIVDAWGLPEEELEVIEETAKEETAELNETKKQLEQELEAAKAELASAANLVGTHSDDEFNRVNMELMAKVAELEEALGRVDQLESERGKNLALAQARRREKAEERKLLLAPDKVREKIRKYFSAVAACFLMDRDSYKDKHGIAPYNRIIVKKNPNGTETVQHVMTAAGDRLHKFGEVLVDLERFINHPKLMPMWVELHEAGTSPARISEKVYTACRQLYKNDFIHNYKQSTDFENLLVLLSQIIILSEVDLDCILVSVNSVDDLAHPVLRESFQISFPKWKELGFESIDQAMVVAYYNKIKKTLTDEELANLIIRDAKKQAVALGKLAKKAAKAA